NHVGGWRRLRSGTGSVCEGGCRRGCLGSKTTRRRGEVIRQLLERSHGRDCFQERDPSEGQLEENSKLEILNSKQIEMIKSRKFQTGSFRILVFRDFGFGFVCFGFRASDFEF